MVLLGWNGSTRAQVSKYEEVYRGFGFGSSLVFTPTVADTYGVDAACLIAHRVVGEIADWGEQQGGEGESKGGVVVHVFSGSVYIWIRMLVWAELFYPDVKDMIAGVVFDSTPIDASASNGTNAVLQVAGLPSVLYPPLYGLFWAYWNLIMPWDPWVRKWKTRFWTSIFPDPTIRVPMAFFYAKDDRIAPYTFIQDQASALIANNIDVTLALVPDDSASRTADSVSRDIHSHCTHLLLHPVWYISRLRAFLASLPSLPAPCVELLKVPPFLPSKL